MESNKLDMGSRDAISCLPQEVLGEILSLLPTKLAASTSDLSKKWRYLFALVHNLDLDDYVMLQHPEGEEWRDEIKESFRNFVERTFALQCGSRIKKFSLSYLKCQRVADKIAACKDHREIRSKFGLVNDSTAEEEAEVLKENQWAFD
ncbi:hypothetical protein HID58_035757 [Brassica napus]|uniref:F-box domain-containing protein n=1 Tax=Brassica napus TaxID=3708 RepID=A0ABQ8C5T4_BRANA|nr:hypothetical protein HID58_035757 [Brassica napus]